MTDFRSEGPLAYWCERRWDALVMDLPIPDPCGSFECSYCCADQLVHDVAATTHVLRQGESSIVALIWSVPTDANPRAAFHAVSGGVEAALGALRNRYDSFEARWTVELDAQGHTNVHVLVPKRRLRLDTLRRAFLSAGLGAEVGMEDIKSPLSISCYTTKIPLATFRLISDGIWSTLKFAMELNGGRFSNATEGFYGSSEIPLWDRRRRSFGRSHDAAVIRWAESWPDYYEKLPPQLLERVPALERLREGFVEDKLD
jgi:hypothetical protein